MDGQQDKRRRGLIMVHTGDGKGKTTAALGLAMRALGHGMRVVMIQFVKSNKRTGEHAMARKLAPQFTLKTMGTGFVLGEWSEEDIAAARDAWKAAREAIVGAEYDMVILDEITYPMEAGAIEVPEVTELLAGRPPEMHVVLTGRDALPELVEAADLVTEMSSVKHPYKAGIRAQAGIEF